METLLEKTPVQPVPFQTWFETLTDKEKSLVRKAQKQGFVVLHHFSDGTVTVQRGNA